MSPKLIANDSLKTKNKTNIFWIFNYKNIFLIETGNEWDIDK